MVLFKIIFWVSIFMIFYAHLGYLLLLKILSVVLPTRDNKTGKTEISQSGKWKKISLLISAYNEEDVIEGKILNSLSLDYPREFLEILVISDGSTDRTDEIVKSYEKYGVALKRFEGRIGKTRCLNLVIPEAGGDYILFSDANSLYPKTLIKEILGPFENQSVGYVTGYTRYFSSEGEDGCGSIGLYSRIEKEIKLLESRIGSCVGADGAVFAIRKHLYRSLQPHDINDFVIPLCIVRQGYRGVLAEDVFCREKAGKDTKSEYYRQVRITNRTLRAIFSHRDLMNPVRYGFFSFQLFSHKLAKFLVPFFLIAVFGSNFLLVLYNDEYVGLLFLQVILAVSAWFFRDSKAIRIISGPATLLYEFLAMNLAILAGWTKYWKSETFTTWSPENR